MPRVTKLYEKSKGSLKHNQGPDAPKTKDITKIAACRRRCRELYGPASANYDPIKLADCERGCQK